MMYRVRMVQTVLEEAYMYIEASSHEMAEKMALDSANLGEGQWHFIEALGDIEVVTCQEVLTDLATCPKDDGI